MNTIEHGWREDKIGNLPISLIDSDRSKRYPKRTEFKKDGVAFLNAESISGGYFDISKVNYISFEKYEEITKGRLQQNDLILTMRGNGVGNTALFTSKIPFGLINAQMLILRPKEGEIHSNFLYYLFINPQFQKLLANFVSGSAQPQLTMTHLRHVRITFPPLPEQKAIAHILGSLDDRIELNRRMNETLEGMAQALFKSWFVDFDPVLDNGLASGKEIPPELREKAEARRKLRDSEAPLHPLPKEICTLFPDEFTFTDELGWIPKGWEVAPLGEVTVELRRGISPKYIEDGGVRVVNQRCIRSHEVNYSLARRNDENKRKVVGRFLEKGDLLINSTGVGTLGRMAQVHDLTEPSVVDSHVTIARADRSKYCPYMFARMMLSLEPYIESMGEGSTGQTELSRKNLAKIQVIVPSMDNQKYTEEYFNDFVAKISLNSQCIDTLSLTRDTLLPKLLSGEIRIPDAEKLVEGIEV